MADEGTVGGGGARRAQHRGRGAAGQSRRSARLSLLIGAAVAILLVLGEGVYYASARSRASRPAAGVAPRPGAPIDGISCQSEMLNYHIHSALIMYDHGRRVMLPADVGIPVNRAIPGGYCLYALHTHDSDHAAGIVHIESPTPKLYTLDQFMDIWHYTALWDRQDTLAAANNISVSASFVDALRRARPSDIHAYVDGKSVGSYTGITFTAHKVITLEIGMPLVKPATRVAFPDGE